METTDFLIKKTGLDSILDFFYPPQCLVCGAYADRVDRLLCFGCFQKILHRDMPFCLSCRHIIESGGNCGNCDSDSSMPVVALGDYADPLREIIHQYKYHGYRKLGRFLAGWLADDLMKISGMPEIDCLVPVPLYGYRLKSRGFNQAAVLADILGNRLDLPVDIDSLHQVRRTKDQVRLNQDDRERNIKGAFAVYGGNLKDKRVAIVDDVITTGATLREIRQVLLTSGARPVCALVVAAGGN